MVAIHLVHHSILMKQTKKSDFVITEDLHISCKYKMHLIDKSKETEKTRKRKTVQEELTLAKKRKEELEQTVNKLFS